MIEIIPNWHPFFVHFTVALITVSAFCYFVGYLLSQRSLGKELLIVARWCLWFGAVMAIATVTAGFIAYYSVAHDAPSHLAMQEHRNWAISTFIVILLVTAWSGWLYLKKRSVGIALILTMILTAILIVITAWYGGEVVYRYGIGVQSLPKSTGKGHQHQHGADKRKRGHGDAQHKH